MPTKPTDLPPVWGDAGVYPLSNYPLLLPWGASNPLSGATPWSAGARLDDTNLVAFASAGMTPQIPLAAEELNEWWRRVQIYVNWVNLGTSADDADAHVMETDGSGISSAQKYQATFGFCNAGITSAIMLAGATIPNGEDLALVGTASIAGVDTTRCLVATVDFQNGGGFGAPTATSVSVSTGGELFFGTSRRVHSSTNGFVYATGDQEAATGLSGVHNLATTTVAVTAEGTGDVRVIAEGQFQVNTLGSTVTFDVQEDQSGFADIGANQEVTAEFDASDAFQWQPFRHSRVFAAGTATATLYRLTSTANGGNLHKIKELNLRVVNERG